ncbi:cleft lip and palate transmembrane protein 1 homolog [Ctenocephalides felis]|uniref:cleft lip and palate transmembrane protein 1 homolog n=1 Tax=Ctenocephalides felis TaxID=7515 RepID=UPI000E6E23FA|nr:cleft lip and palate transmembrane protein 1 homolog [Ctenocephalides felis]
MSQPEQTTTDENAPAVAEGEPSFDDQVRTQRERMQPTKMESFMAMMKSFLLRALFIYFITSFLRRSSQPADTSTESAGAGAGADPSLRRAAENAFLNGTYFDLHVYLSESDIQDFTQYDLLWKQQSLVYGDWYSGENFDGTYSSNIQIKTTKNMRNNGSFYLHIYVTYKDISPDPSKGNGYNTNMGYTVHRLNKYKKLRYVQTHNLLTGESEKSEEELEKSKYMKEEILSHWHPNLTINLVTDHTKWVRGSVPSPLDEHIHFLPGNRYAPVLFVNDFWNMIRDYKPINSTTDELELHLTYQPLSMIKWQMYSAQTMRSKWSGNIFSTDENEEDQDSLKEALLDTNPYLLGLTVVISILHSVFELLAFKNDIQFWNNRKSLEGLSVRSVFFNVFQSVIVLLYVLDNETNAMIKISCFLGLAIEIWKIQKVVDISINRDHKILGFLPKIKFTDKGSYIESSTRQYDQLAFRYLSWLCFPLLVGYGVYSLLYQEHKGWYSFTLNMLYGFLLTFGFIMMTPQLFINYKMKSVAHLPWRMMSYKFLNTFIDDIFAFVIKMPTMYRLGCFRDDIVFFIFLYQRWIYKVDKSRINEFGFSADMENEAKNKQNGTLAINESQESSSNENKTEAQKKDD